MSAIVYTRNVKKQLIKVLVETFYVFYVLKIFFNVQSNLSYKERIKGKFGLDSIVECVAYAVKRGLVSV